MWVKQPNFLELKNSQTSDSLLMKFFKNENIKFGQINIYVFFRGYICFTYQFLEDQKLKQGRSCEFWKKISDLSDLTPDVRSYPVLRYSVCARTFVLVSVVVDPQSCVAEPDPTF
jgi:hypothetical protein